jgi:hypothetical protein
MDWMEEVPISNKYTHNARDLKIKQTPKYLNDYPAS